MKSMKNRIQRVEELVNEEKGLTLEDVELILSVLPAELADAIMKKLLECTDREFKSV